MAFHCHYKASVSFLLVRLLPRKSWSDGLKVPSKFRRLEERVRMMPISGRTGSLLEAESGGRRVAHTQKVQRVLRSPLFWFFVHCTEWHSVSASHMLQRYKGIVHCTLHMVCLNTFVQIKWLQMVSVYSDKILDKMYSTAATLHTIQHWILYSSPIAAGAAKGKRSPP